MASLPMQLQPFTFGDITILLATPQAGYLRLNNGTGDRRAPYWAKVWPAAVALGEFLIANTALIAGKRVLELAAGLGLPGLVAAQYADAVTLSDREPLAVEMLHRNAALNSSEFVQCQVLDWSALPDEIYNTDVLLMSDVNYDPQQFSVLHDVFMRFLQNGTTILLSTPQRLMAKPFIEQLLPYVVHQTERYVEMESGSAWVSVFVLQNISQ